MTSQPEHGQPAAETVVVPDPVPGVEPTTETMDAVDAGAADATDEERPWWDDPSLPWAHKPTRADLICWTLLSVYAIYGLIMIPLRAWLLTMPYVSAWINGSRTALVAVGALTRVHPDPAMWWLWAWLAATVAIMKWDLLLWWAGRLWGRQILDMWGGKGPRARRFTDGLQRFASRHPGFALVLTYLPIPFSQVIYPTLGAAGVGLKKFLLLDALWAFLFQGLYLGLGYWIGLPAVKALDVYARYANYVGIALLVVTVVLVVRRQRAQNAATGAARGRQDPADEAPVEQLQD